MNQIHDMFAVFGTDQPHGAMGDRLFADQMVGLRNPLINFGRDRWAPLLQPEYVRRMREPWVGSNSEQQISFETLGEVCCTYRLPEGRTPVQVFADEAPGLSAEQRDTLRGWTEVIKGPFDFIERREHLSVVTQIDSTGRSFQVHSPMMALLPELLGPGMLLLGRLVPVRDFFINLGAFQIVVPEARDQVVRFYRQKFNRNVRSQARWTPMGGQNAPASTAPCPCSSGRRYKKCCQPR